MTSAPMCSKEGASITCPATSVTTVVGWACSSEGTSLTAHVTCCGTPPQAAASDESQQRPHCSFVRNCPTPWSSTREVCAVALCKASGYSGGSWVSDTGDMCQVLAPGEEHTINQCYYTCSKDPFSRRGIMLSVVCSGSYPPRRTVAGPHALCWQALIEDGCVAPSSPVCRRWLLLPR